MDVRAVDFPNERGVLADQMRDCVYHIPRSGALYTTHWMSAETSMRFFCVVGLSARGAPFKLRVNDRIEHMEAVALKAMVERGVGARLGVQLTSFEIDPRHPAFRAFRAIPAPGLLRLDRNDFDHLNPALERACAGQLSIEEAIALFHAVIGVAMRSLPPPPPLDKRVIEMLTLLRPNSNIPLARLAQSVGLSESRASHLFADSMGLPLKSYQLWQKLHHAVALLATGRSLTAVAYDAGFTDSSHLSRTFQQVYGAPPSYFTDPAKVLHVAQARG